jgi:hypothetical protein
MHTLGIFSAIGFSCHLPLLRFPFVHAAPCHFF